MKIRRISQTVGLILIVSAPALADYRAPAEIDRKNVNGRLQTRLSADEIAREALDEQAYPHFMQFLKTVDVSRGLHDTDPRNLNLIGSKKFFHPTPEMWDGFFKSAAADHLTCLRAFALLAREVKKNGVSLYGPGGLFQQAVMKNQMDLGLALPAKNIGASLWKPDPQNHDPEFLLHLKVFYTEPYVHQFPDEILPANLKIGFGAVESYWLDGVEYKQAVLDADIYYGAKNGIGFKNVKGVGGQKRGVLGFFQKVFFFLPDAVDSMTIRENTGEMITEAMINTVVKDFEKTPRYSIRRVQN